MLKPDQLLMIARIAFTSDRAVAVATGEKWGPKWEEATDALRESAVEGVKAILADPNLAGSAIAEVVTIDIVRELAKTYAEADAQATATQAPTTEAAA